MQAQESAGQHERSSSERGSEPSTMANETTQTHARLERRKANRRFDVSQRTQGLGWKHRAPRAVKEIKLFAQKAMGTNDVRIDPSLNAATWALGIKSVPRRMRVRLSRE